MSLTGWLFVIAGAAAFVALVVKLTKSDDGKGLADTAVRADGTHVQVGPGPALGPVEEAKLRGGPRHRQPRSAA